MTRAKAVARSRGYFGIGIERSKTEANVGTLWRSAFSLGASFIFTIGRRYPRQSSDVTEAWRHIPLLEFVDVDDFHAHIPFDCQVVGVESMTRMSRLVRRLIDPAGVQRERAELARAAFLAEIRVELHRLIRNDLVRGGYRGTGLADDILVNVEALAPETLRASAAYMEERQ